MIFEQSIREALKPENDALNQAKSRVSTRAVGAEYRRRRALVHAALERVVPTAPEAAGCTGSAS